MEDLTSFYVSVIIPTYKDWDRLRLCIDKLTKQNFHSSNFEVIIVNNDPDDDIPSEIDVPENFSIVSEPRSGSYAARNTGIQLAKGDIIGFTDSDCLPDENWISNAVRIFEQGNYDRVAGHIEVFYEDADRPTNAELYEKVFAFKQEETVNTIGACVTGNMFTKKSVFFEVGNFNKLLFSGGDYEWGTRAFKRGFNIFYAKEVIVYHPARKTLSELLKKAKRVGGGAGASLEGNTMLAVRDYLKTFEPAKHAFYMIKNYGKEISFFQKIKVLLVRFYIRHTMNLEKLKVAFGKLANRE